jgi:hypothetical protein
MIDYCWRDIASRYLETPVAFAASEAHDIKLHAHEDKVREEMHTRCEARAHADVFGSDEMMPRALASACSARDEMKNENGYEIGNGQSIYLAM